MTALLTIALTFAVGVGVPLTWLALDAWAWARVIEAIEGRGR